MKCQVGWLAHFATHVLTSTLIRNVRIFVVHEYCTPRTDTNTNRCSCLLASCSVCEASIRPLDEHPLQNKGQVFVPWTNTLPSTWGKYSSHGRIPSLAHGASIRQRTNTLSKTRGKYSSTDEYPCGNMGQVFVHRRITSHKRGVNTCW